MNRMLMNLGAVVKKVVHFGVLGVKVRGRD